MQSVLIGLLIAIGSKLIIEFVKWTIKKIKEWRSRRQNPIIAARLKELYESGQIPKVSMKDLSKTPNAVIYAEYDEDEEKVVKSKCTSEADESILDAIDSNGGVIALTD